MDPALLQQILGAGPLAEQQTQADQELQDLIARRRTYQAQGSRTGAGALLGGIADIIMGNREGDIRAKQADLSKQMAGVRGQYGQAWLGTPMGPAAPPGMPDHPPRIPLSPEDQTHLASLGELSGDPLMGKMAAGALLRGQQAPKLALETEQARKVQQENQAMESPEGSVALRALLGKYGVPGLSEKTPNAVMRALLPTAEKGYAVEQTSPKFGAAFPGSQIYNVRTGQAPPGGGGGSDIIKQTADGIENGTSPPDMKGLGRLRVPVQAELATRGFNLSQANLDWQATQKHLATLNSGGQERLNQAINFVSDTIPVIRQLYAEWQQLAGVSGYKILNKGTLAAMKQLPGRPGAVAQALETQINDFASELGTVYKGGGTSTDKSLGMAATNLQADWNPETFNAALNLAEKNIAIRKNSVAHSTVRGASQANPYATAPVPEAATGGGGPVARKFTRGPDGKLVEVK